MLTLGTSIVAGCVRQSIRCLASIPGGHVSDIVTKPLEEHLNPTVELHKIEIDVQESVMIEGSPVEHGAHRRARIFQPAREAPQSGLANTKLWKIELDTKERWENPLMGWQANGDPLSNIGMNLDFATAEDAMRFCDKRDWEYEVLEPQTRRVKPKNYGVNYHWSKKTRVSNK